jgi:hypothetical protein
MRDEQIVDLLRKLYPDRDTTGFNVLDFLHAEGSPVFALLYGRLFWPEFVEIDDMIFLKETYEDADDRQRIADAFAHYKRDRRKTEQAFNVVEVPFLFGRRVDELTEEEYVFLAERLAEMWRCRLQMVYPQRRFTVKVLTPEQTGSEVGVVFYQD